MSDTSVAARIVALRRRVAIVTVARLTPSRYVQRAEATTEIRSLVSGTDRQPRASLTRPRRCTTRGRAPGSSDLLRLPHANRHRRHAARGWLLADDGRPPQPRL